MNYKKIDVPVQLCTAQGWQVFQVPCIDAPTLTTSLSDLLMAMKIPYNYQLQWCGDDVYGNQTLGGREAYIIRPDGSCRFIAVPPATM